MCFSRINVFRRFSEPVGLRTKRETRRRQVQIYRTTFPERAYPSDLAALITFHKILNSSYLDDPPRKRSRHWRVFFAPVILMDTRVSMRTKGCWFSVEGVFVVLMRYNGMDPGCWYIARSGVPRFRGRARAPFGSPHRQGPQHVHHVSRLCI